MAGDEDNLLIRADKNPNRRGAELIGLGQADGRAILEGARQRRVKLLWIFQHDLLDSGWPQADVTAALAGAETVVATHWPIADDTGELFRPFYSALKSGPDLTSASASAALRTAQLRMISSQSWRANPRFWASFL